jgi:DNA-binding winged helix-turn-helix (wHTH) protein
MNTGLAPAQYPQQKENLNPANLFPSRYARFGGFDLDLHRQELYKDGSRVKLQGKVCEVLLILLQNPGEVVTREALRTRLWPDDAQVNYDANVNTTVNKLRQMLGDTPEKPIFVETIPRKGYCFVGKVEYADQSAIRANESETSATESTTQGSAKVWIAALRSAPPKTWVAAGALILVLAGMLFGAALVLFAHRPISASPVISASHSEVNKSRSALV